MRNREAIAAPAEPYNEDYFLRGKELGISGYTDYRWMPTMTIPMCCAMVRHLGIEPDDSILDFGCARGYTVKAFREMGYNAYGYDCSQWAIDNCDPAVRDHVFRSPAILKNLGRVDWVIAKDVLEHIEEPRLDEEDGLYGVVDMLKRTARKGVFIVVPLAHGPKYDVAEYENDVTHVQRRTLQWWCGLFHQRGWSVEGRYRVAGVKDNYAQYPTGNGFITVRRLD